MWRLINGDNKDKGKFETTTQFFKSEKSIKKMKKSLIIPLLFVCFMSVGQTINPASIIGKSVRIGHLEVAQFDFPNEMTWDEAQKACTALGKGWRLPTRDELKTVYQNRKKIGDFSNYIYWSNAEDAGTAWSYDFSRERETSYYKDEEYVVRAVRSF